MGKEFPIEVSLSEFLFHRKEKLSDKSLLTME